MEWVVVVDFPDDCTKRLFQVFSSETSVPEYDDFTEGDGPVSSREKASLGRSGFFAVL